MSQFLVSQPLACSVILSKVLASSVFHSPHPTMGEAGLGEFCTVLVFFSLSVSFGHCPVLGSRVPDLMTATVTVGQWRG